jgi:hypothetical protein
VSLAVDAVAVLEKNEVSLGELAAKLPLNRSVTVIIVWLRDSVSNPNQSGGASCCC